MVTFLIIAALANRGLHLSHTRSWYCFANEPSRLDGLSTCIAGQMFIGANKNNTMGLQIFGAIITEYLNC